jgi:hypothetical protein
MEENSHSSRLGFRKDSYLLSKSISVSPSAWVASVLVRSSIKVKVRSYRGDTPSILNFVKRKIVPIGVSGIRNSGKSP